MLVSRLNMNFEALIADLVEKIDENESPRTETRHSLARSLALSKSRPAVIENVNVRDLSSPNDDKSLVFEGEVLQGRLKQNVSLDLDYKDLSVSLRTEQSIAIEVCTLRAQVGMLAEQLVHAHSRLDQSHRKIGFLEAQLLIQDEQIRQLRLEQTERPKKRRTLKGRSAR
jgi:hypothetical protein